MKKSIVLCVGVLLMATSMLSAHLWEWQWANDIGGTSSTGKTCFDAGYGICLDAEGNSYVTGVFGRTAVFGPDTLSSGSNNTIFVAKADIDGNWLWGRQAVRLSTGFCQGMSVCTDADGNVYFSGSFYDKTYFGPDSLIPNGAADVVVAKLDTDGNWLWAVSGGGSSYDYGRGISVDANGDVYVTGEFWNTATFGSSSITSSGSTDIFAAKLDTDGNWLWAKNAGGSNSDKGNGISVDANGNSYITGQYSSSTADFGSITIINSGNDDIFAAKLDTDGNWLWAKDAGGSEWDHGNGISIDAEGNSYITGDIVGTANFGSIVLTSAGETDIFVAKLDTDGNWQWAKNAGGSKADGGYDTSVDADGKPYVTGCFDETATFGSITLINTGEGYQDVFVAGLDTDGNWLWAKDGVGTGYNRGSSIAVDANGYSYITGEFYGNLTFGDITLTTTGDFEYDLFTANLYYIIGDFNDDGYVNATDLQLFGDHWLFVDTDPGWNAMYDLDPDGVINAADLQIFGDHWNEGTPPDMAKDDGSKGPNSGAGISFDLDATTFGNQNLTHIAPQAAGTMIRVDVYATGVHNLDTYEFNVVYDPNVLEYKGCAATNPLTFEENILTSEGGTAIGWMVDNSTPGILNIAYTLAGEDTTQAPEGEGLIADIVFQAKVTTYGMLSFSNVYYYDTFKVKDAITNLGTATLPVELSAFTATYNTVNGYTTLSWTTASETDILGYNVYRSTEDAFDTSKQLNAAMINGHGTTTEMNTYEFVDVDQLNFGTTYYYWLESIEYGGISTVYTSIKLTPEEGNGGFIDDFSANSLSNYPNPFRNTTTISYSIKGMLKSEPVQISIYNMLGQLVDTVEGKYGTATWNTKDHSTGIYFYKLNTDSYTEIKKMMVTK